MVAIIDTATGLKVSAVKEVLWLWKGQCKPKLNSHDQTKISESHILGETVRSTNILIKAMITETKNARYEQIIFYGRLFSEMELYYFVNSFNQTFSLSWEAIDRYWDSLANQHLACLNWSCKSILTILWEKMPTFLITVETSIFCESTETGKFSITSNKRVADPVKRVWVQ